MYLNINQKRLLLCPPCLSPASAARLWFLPREVDDDDNRNVAIKQDFFSHFNKTATETASRGSPSDCVQEKPRLQIEVFLFSTSPAVEAFRMFRVIKLEECWQLVKLERQRVCLLTSRSCINLKPVARSLMTLLRHSPESTAQDLFALA